MKAVILSAGQGRRLLPLTASVPKCVLEVDGRTIIERQIETLFAAGVDEIVVVVGYAKSAVEELLENRAPRVRTLFNPFHSVSDNLVSCWTARSEMDGDFLLLNGDTLFESAVASKLMESRKPITVTVDRKAEYDDDDMKVHARDDRMLRIGKRLPANESDAEAIGMIQFLGEGPARFCQALDRAMEQPEALRQWYLTVIDRLADEGIVSICSIEGLHWAEIDTREDLDGAARILNGESKQIPAS